MRYSSLHADSGLPPTPNHDLESLSYVLAFLAMGSLPWQKAPGGLSKADKLVAFRKAKAQTPPEAVLGLKERDDSKQDTHPLAREGVADDLRLLADFMLACRGLKQDEKLNFFYWLVRFAVPRQGTSAQDSAVEVDWLPRLREKFGDNWAEDNVWMERVMVCGPGVLL
eukprot:TRINITY_DN16590_c0_g1_i4.p1 TRINITY_DN16590_c0_g1~~TRINITY_DN16590_c0_g1_i4.p1  ORF type:complete len:168 (-),score=33.72 TRINITY_DN16590_c0_g1_i4:22-525(-)